MIFVAPIQAGLALVLAVLINQKLRGINIFRTIYFMPVVVSIVVVSLLWRFIYSGQSGLLNNMLGFLSFGAFKPVDWLGNQATALWSILAMSVWQGVGFHMVIWLSGLQTIPVTLYEAADIEGATNWQKFRYVTWPGLRNTAVLIPDRDHHAGLLAVLPDRRNDRRRPARLDADHGVPGSAAWL